MDAAASEHASAQVGGAGGPFRAHSGAAAIHVWTWATFVRSPAFSVRSPAFSVRSPPLSSRASSRSRRASSRSRRASSRSRRAASRSLRVTSSASRSSSSSLRARARPPHRKPRKKKKPRACLSVAPTDRGCTAQGAGGGGARAPWFATLGRAVARAAEHAHAVVVVLYQHLKPTRDAVAWDG